jgi:hypothetical protein
LNGRAAEQSLAAARRDSVFLKKPFSPQLEI